MTAAAKNLRPMLAALLAALPCACSRGASDPASSSSSHSASSSSSSTSVGGSGGGGSGGGGSGVGGSGVGGSGVDGGAGGGGGTGKVVLFENFDGVSATSFSDGKDHMLASGMSLGAQAGGVVSFEVDPAQTYGGTGKSVKGSYPVATGDVYAWGGFGLDQYSTDNVYVRFRAKMPGNHHGLKFLKVFGQQVQGSGYANTTFGLDYTGVDYGSMYATGFGQGDTVNNDTANVVLFDGTNPTWTGRSYGLPGYSVLTPQSKPFASADWGAVWHLFELHVKFNSGTTMMNEKNDGELFVRIDGKVYVDAKGLYNRHYLNAPIGSVQILGWSQGGSAPFDIWYDNVEIAIGGWGNSPV